MPLDIYNLKATVSVDTRQAERELQRFSTQAQGLGSKVSSSTKGATAGFDDMSKSLRGLGTTMQGIIGLQFAGMFRELVAGSVQAANSLEKTQATVLALSGSQARYNEVLATAKAGQQAYGGSLEETLRGLGTLVNLSNKSGVELSKLDQIARRLAIVDPLQGVEGANYALKEFLSGSGATSIRSLVERFELPRSALRALSDESLSAAEKMAGLDAALNDLGISSDVLTNRTLTTAATYDRLGASFSNAQVAIGSFIATGLQPLAEAATAAFGSVAAGVAQLTTVQGNMTTLNGALVSGSDSFDQYAARANEAANQLISTGNVFPVLTQAQYEYAQSLIANGESAEAAAQKAADMGKALGDISNAQSKLAQDTNLSQSAIDELGSSLERTASSSQANEDAVIAMSRAYLMGNISAEQFAAGVKALELSAAAQSRVTAEAARIAYMYGAAATNSTSATQAHSAALQEDAAKSLLAAANAQELAMSKQMLEQQARAAAQALVLAGDVGAAKAAQLAQSSSLVDQLTAAYYRLGIGAQQAAQMAINAMKAAAMIAPQLGVAIPGFSQVLKGIAFERVSGKPAFEAPLAPVNEPKKGGGGGGSKISEEERVQEKLADIAERGAERLVEIDKRMVEQRMEAYRQLQASILTLSADMVAQQEANDLELVGMSEERLREMIPREQAEADARVRMAEAVQEARRIAAEGDAELAQKTLDIQSKAIEDRQALDEAYYEKQQELAGDPEQLAILKQQYDEAVAAQEQAANIRIELAQQQAQQVAAKAAEERAAVIAEAQEQADKVKGAANDQKAAVISALDAQAAAANSWASSVGSAADRVVSAAERAAGAIGKIPSIGSSSGSTGVSGSSSGGSGATKAGGGGTFITNGKTNITVGDNPGGAELVHVVPLSGTGTTTVGDGWAKLAGGGTILAPSDDTNPALRLRDSGGSGGGKSSAGGGSAPAENVAEQLQKERDSEIFAELEALRRKRELKRMEEAEQDALDARMEAEYREKERALKDTFFYQNLQNNLAELRENRELRRKQQQEEDTLDLERDKRAAEIAAQKRAEIEQGIASQKNADLTKLQKDYYTQAQGIVEQYGQSQSELTQLWGSIQLADLQANYQEQRQEANEAYAQQSADATQNVEQLAQEQAEAEFQARYDALEDAQFIEDALLNKSQQEREEYLKEGQKQQLEAIKQTIESAFQLERDALEDMSFVRRQFIEDEIKRIKELMEGQPAPSDGLGFGSPAPIMRPGPIDDGPGGSERIGIGSVTIGAGNNVTMADVKRAIKEALAEIGTRTEIARRTGGRR